MKESHSVTTDAFKVLNAGMLATVQDLGRFGQANLGLTTSGPADLRAFQWANRLLDNTENSALLEVTFGGLKLRSNIRTTICITGAKVSLTVNGQSKDMWTTCKVYPNDVIELGYAEQGTRVYLAVKEGFAIDQAFGSCATTVREGIGGIDGKGLVEGDCLPAYATEHPLHSHSLSADERPNYTSEVSLRLVTGYQYEAFCNVELRRFFSSWYTVSRQWDRMGYRLEGPAIKVVSKAMLSEGIALGAVQIPPDGQPIVLMQDRQTIGGYPKVGSVFSLDLAKLAQCAHGARVQFEAISIEQAHNELHLDKYKYFNTRVISSPW